MHSVGIPVKARPHLNPRLFTISLALQLLSSQLSAANVVSLVTDKKPAPPVWHGVVALKAALSRQGTPVEEANTWEDATGQIVVIAGLVDGQSEASKLLSQRGFPAPPGPESLLVRKWSENGKQIIFIIGADARGLMYALLDVAERVSWAKGSAEPFSEVRDVTERPDTTERAVSIYTFNRAYWESRFYDEEYWARYFETLAQSRFNSLVVIFGYENGGFLAPCYPYFFDLDQFPGVRMVGITREEQQRNLAALNKLIEMAHDRGLSFTVGIWDHIYRGGVQGGGIPGADEATKKPVPGLVWGLSGENLVPYTKAALAEFVKRAPALDWIQFRMHDESGLKTGEQEQFWRDVFQSMKETSPQLRLDLRAKGLPNSVIRSAAEIGVNFRITTKYWMEQMGLPFHPTHVNRENQFDRRHSYADLLVYPQPYKVHWRLWNGGTARVLLWGDPEYARRFAESTHLYDGDGFEVNEPLCTKMEAQPQDAQPFELLNSSRRYYQYEFERYWHFFQVFGRIGYNPNTPPEVWKREFEKRFGTEAAPFVEKGLHLASWVLPRIVASCYPYSAFPMTRGWAEKQRLGDLPAYARAEGSDLEQFASFDEEAALLTDHGVTAKVRPGENSLWFAQTAGEIIRQVAQAEERIGLGRSKEFDSTITDLKILANLALFHSRRIPAAVSYRLFERTKDPHALDDAISFEQSAKDAWAQMVRAAGDFYSEDLMMGVRGASLCGHWKDELTALNKGISKLEEQRQKLPRSDQARTAPRFVPGSADRLRAAPVVVHEPVRTAPVGKSLTITAQVNAPADIRWVHLRYRPVNQTQDYRTLPMLGTGETDQYRAVVPAAEIVPTWDFSYFIEAMDVEGNGRIYPDLNKQTPYIVVKLQR